MTKYKAGDKVFWRYDGECHRVRLDQEKMNGWLVTVLDALEGEGGYFARHEDLYAEAGVS